MVLLITHDLCVSDTHFLASGHVGFLDKHSPHKSQWWADRDCIATRGSHFHQQTEESFFKVVWFEGNHGNPGTLGYWFTAHGERKEGLGLFHVVQNPSGWKVLPKLALVHYQLCNHSDPHGLSATWPKSTLEFWGVSKVLLDWWQLLPQRKIPFVTLHLAFPAVRSASGSCSLKSLPCCWCFRLDCQKQCAL